MTEGATRPGPTVTGFAINCAIAALRKHNIDPSRRPYSRVQLPAVEEGGG